MVIQLRTLLLSSMLLLGQAPAQQAYFDITVGMMGNTTMHDGNTFPIWGFRDGGSGMSPYGVPGPTIRAKEGDQVTLHFRNTSGMPHTVHPHGLDVSQVSDGVPQTSFEIDGNGVYDYQFIAPHAGTYAYHCHVQTVLHLQMGMYGTIVIDPADSTQAIWQGGPNYDLERIWVMGEYDSYWHNIAAETNSGFPYHDYNPDYFIVNGESGSDIAQNPISAAEMTLDQTLLVRINNMGYLGNRLHFNGLAATVVSSDGRPLPEQQSVTAFTIYPGERYDFIIHPDSVANYVVDVDYLSVYGESIQGTAVIPINVTSPVSTNNDHQGPQNYILRQNYPNPFNPSTTITYSLPTNASVTLKVYNTLGQEVKTLINYKQTAGEKSIIWSGRDNAGNSVSAGIYIYVLQAPDFKTAMQMVLLK